MCRNFVNKLWNAGKYMQLCIQNVATANNGGAADADAVVAWERPHRLWTASDMQSMRLPERFIVSRCHQVIASVTTCLSSHQFGEAGRIISDFLWDEVADWFIEMSKAHIRHTDPVIRQQALHTLLYVWDISLRLLHPYMPYVTEALWQQLPAAPSSSESLMTAAWPDFQSPDATTTVGDVDDEALKTFAKVQALVRAIRNARADFQVDASKKIALYVRTSNPLMQQTLDEEKASLLMFGKIDENKYHVLSWESEAAVNMRASVAAGGVVHLVISEDIEAFLPQADFLDREKEQARLTKQREKLLKDVTGLETRLANPNFANKAPPHLVKEVQDKLQDLRQQLLTVETTLQSL